MCVCQCVCTGVRESESECVSVREREREEREWESEGGDREGEGGRDGNTLAQTLVYELEYALIEYPLDGCSKFYNKIQYALDDFVLN